MRIFVGSLLCLTGVGAAFLIRLVHEINFPAWSEIDALNHFGFAYLAAYILSVVGACILVNTDEL